MLGSQVVALSSSFDISEMNCGILVFYHRVLTGHFSYAE